MRAWVRHRRHSDAFEVFADLLNREKARFLDARGDDDIAWLVARAGKAIKQLGNGGAQGRNPGHVDIMRLPGFQRFRRRGDDSLVQWTEHAIGAQIIVESRDGRQRRAVQRRIGFMGCQNL